MDRFSNIETSSVVSHEEIESLVDDRVEPAKWRVGKKLLLSLVISICIFGYFLWKLDFTGFVRMVQNLSLPWVAICLFCICKQVLIRSLRLSEVFGAQNMKFKDAFLIQGMYMPINNILPAGLGDVTLIYLMRKISRVKIGSGVGCYLLLRSIELTITLLMFIGFVLFAKDLDGALSYFVDKAKLLVILLFAVLILMYAFLLNKRLFALATEREIFKKKVWANKIHHFLTNLREQIVYSLSSLTIVKVVLYSVLFYIFTYFYFFAALRAMHIALNLSQILFVFIMFFPFEILPVRGPANLGIYELAWVILLGILGFSQAESIVIAFTAHGIDVFCLFLYLVILGPFFLTRLWAIRKR